MLWGDEKKLSTWGKEGNYKEAYIGVVCWFGARTLSLLQKVANAKGSGDFEVWLLLNFTCLMLNGDSEFLVPVQS